MSYRITGLHHVTAMSANLQANVDFYTGVLGLKLVKVTVNHDDPSALHLYYGDETGSPGSLVTFFIYPGMQRGKVGVPQVDGVSLDLPQTDYRRVQEKLKGELDDGVTSDPDAMRVELDEPGATSARLGTHRAFLSDASPTKQFMKAFLSAEFVEGSLFHDNVAMFTGETSSVMAVDLIDPRYGGLNHAENESDRLDRGRPGAGTVHHVAFRISTDEEQEELHAKLAEAGMHVSPIVDRIYFKSIYFREPGGILLEVATDGPGFAVDEDADKLGQKLCLPSWLEKRRPEIEAAVPTFRNPNLE